MKIIVGFAGYAGAGKDTLANAIERYAARFVNSNTAKIAFADPMRDMLLALGVPREYMVERALKEVLIPGFGRSYRQLAQTLGTEWGRVCHGEDFWVNAAANRVDKSGAELVLMTDVRFPNEADYLRRRGGYLVRVNRAAAVPVNPHESETHVPNFKPFLDVFNDGSLDQLDGIASSVFRDILDVRTRSKNGRH